MKPVQTDWFQFGSVFYDKNRFKPVWLGFSGLAWFFQFSSVFYRFGSVFFRFGFGLVFFVLGYKTETKPNRNQTKPTSFFKILIGLTGFFLRFDFFNYLFSDFLSFSVILLSSNTIQRWVAALYNQITEKKIHQLKILLAIIYLCVG